MSGGGARQLGGRIDRRIAIRIHESIGGWLGVRIDDRTARRIGPAAMARRATPRAARGAAAGRTLGAVALAVLAIACSGEESAKPAGGAPPVPATREPETLEAGTSKPAASPSAPVAAPEASAADLVARGRSVWMSNCIACHAQDPTQDGALGPAVAGSSKPLIEARVLRAEYPPGYQPKRDTRVMIALPHLANDIDALYAYLQAAAKG